INYQIKLSLHTFYAKLTHTSFLSKKSLVGVAGSATRAAIVQHQAINNNLADVSAKDGSQSLVGVAGSATRAAIVQHQAINNNLADVSAKDGSQETLSNLLAWLLNFILLYMVTGNQLCIWFCFICCTIVHLYSNYRAVKCLKLRTFNRTRFHLAIQQWFEQQLCHVLMSNNNSNNNDMNKIPEYLLMNKSFPHVIWINECEPILYKTDQPTIIMGCSLYKLPIE
ncbi:uncharacterized protein DC041_0000993, partial [Schistosoma bovis]